jgi:eukaryotic-like serine/threonine-protein kinase
MTLQAIELSPEDDLLRALEGASVRAASQPEVSYRLGRVIGAGSYAVAFVAVRSAPDGESPAVLKCVRPSLLRAAGDTALLSVEKETVALGRLNERVPTTPFVVRLLAADSIEVTQGGTRLQLPWLALEYVHGGAEGTTLEERIDFSVERTGYAFDPERAALALTCIASGLDAIHEVGVVHRDLSPHNVLCCGFGSDEIFKIADFGIARPQSSATGTFVIAPAGTPGYTAPEQIGQSDRPVGPETDVFSLGALLFRMLTGEEYFPSRTAIEGALLARERDRRTLIECKALCPELRERSGVCDRIDRLLARATAYDQSHRPESAWELAAGVLRALEPEQRNSRPPRRRLESISDYSAPTRFGWSWRLRHQPGDARVVRSAAWDADGRCLAATAQGLAFWNGTSWLDVPTDGLPRPHGIRFVERVGPGVWLVGGDGGTIAYYSSSGVTSLLAADDPRVSFSAASGSLSDLAVLVGDRPGEPPLLFALAARRWMKPASLSPARNVTGIARLGDDRWLISGRARSGGGFAAIYTPLMFEVERIGASEVLAYTGCDAQPDLGFGVVVGTGGRALSVQGSSVTPSEVPGDPDLGSVAVDAGGRAWATSIGSVWLHRPEHDLSWTLVWQDLRWTVPFVGIFADVGRVIALTIDGAVVEGRWEPTPSG